VRAVGAIVLAAGSSKRMGEPKQLLKFQGKTLVRRAVEAVVDAGCASVVVVVGNAAQAVEDELKDLRIQVAMNEQWQRGIGSSLRTGAELVLKLKPALDAIMIMLCDQPRVDAQTIRRLIDAHETSGKSVCISAFAGTMGPPVIVGSQFFAALQGLPDSWGAKAIWAAHPDQVLQVPAEEAAFDIDTPQDYAALSGG